MTKSVKALNPKMMMTEKQAGRLGSEVEWLGDDIRCLAYSTRHDSTNGRRMYRRMIAVADALYKLAGAK